MVVLVVGLVGLLAFWLATLSHEGPGGVGNAGGLVGLAESPGGFLAAGAVVRRLLMILSMLATLRLRVSVTALP